MSNCAWMEWCADARSGTATRNTANSARMLKRLIFAPEKKEQRRIVHPPEHGNKSTGGPHRISWFRRRRPRCSARNRARAALELTRTFACTVSDEQRKRGSHEHSIHTQRAGRKI